MNVCFFSTNDMSRTKWSLLFTHKKKISNIYVNSQLNTVQALQHMAVPPPVSRAEFKQLQAIRLFFEAPVSVLFPLPVTS